MRLLPFLLLATVPLVFCSSRGKSTPEQTFWNWFKDHENQLYNFESYDRNRLFDQLANEMHQVHPNLTFEFGPKENGKREFVISADGIKEAFPAVQALYASAPKLPQWTFIAFRPRRKPFDISYSGVTVRAASVHVQLRPNNDLADVVVFIPGYSQASANTYTGIAFLFLDQAVGEYDVEMRIGTISVKPLTEASAEAYPLDELPRVLDALLPRKAN